MKKTLFTVFVCFLITFPLFAQLKTIKGGVVDQNGQPVIGAVVLQEGTQNGTVTSIDGDFELTVPKGAKVIITGIGYEDASF
ncbi:MAG: carboxypeptidase-like regulatory domain-containing protein, partial [Bacteroidales bacterium]|nr:carboxypeptidase-like regulatory domain-containing protein [Bacteroidales bacterium]